MVVGLDGIERVLETINPNTKRQDIYTCTGYYNLGKLSEHPDKLIDWYKPKSGHGECHSFEFLKLYAKTQGSAFNTYVRGTDEFNRLMEKQDGNKR